MLFGTHTHRMLPVSRLKNITCGFLLSWFFFFLMLEKEIQKNYFECICQSSDYLWNNCVNTEEYFKMIYHI